MEKFTIDPKAKPFAHSAGVIEGGLFEGYLHAEEYLPLLTDVERLNDAIKTIRAFERAMREAGKVEEM